MIHRVDGPIGLYRGLDSDIDGKICDMNNALADATIFQSQYSLDKHVELGLSFKNPSIIHNAVDPNIFNNKNRMPPPDGLRKIRLIATSWSDNPKKGGPLLSWLDEHLDNTKYELTFVGRTKTKFKNVRIVEPVSSEKLADILRQNDIYIAPSQDDPCSNALIEALACGLPTAFLNSGGHPELVKEGGEKFADQKDMLEAIDTIARDYKKYQENIEILPLTEVANHYLKVFNL
jgi:glycosyltransferase involved in cell wall biosynthesis